jgi:hypothetical protein
MTCCVNVKNAGINTDTFVAFALAFSGVSSGACCSQVSPYSGLTTLPWKSR